MNFKVGTLLAVSLLGLTACGGSAKKEITAEEWTEKAAAVKPVEYTKCTTKVSYSGKNYSWNWAYVVDEEEPDLSGWDLAEGETGPQTMEEYGVIIMVGGMLGMNAQDLNVSAIPEDYEVTCYSDLSIKAVATEAETETMPYPNEESPLFTITMETKDASMSYKFDQKTGILTKMEQSSTVTISGIPDEYAEAMAQYNYANGETKSSMSVSYSYSK